MKIDLRDLWIAMSLIVGFQFTLFQWRIDREARMVEKEPKQKSWLPPSDWMGGASMLCFVLGGIMLPAIGIIDDVNTAQRLFGLGTLLALGQIIGLAGHYELFTIKVRSQAFFPLQEQIVLAMFALLTAWYCWRAWIVG